VTFEEIANRGFISSDDQALRISTFAEERVEDGTVIEFDVSLGPADDDSIDALEAQTGSCHELHRVRRSGYERLEPTGFQALGGAGKAGDGVRGAQGLDVRDFREELKRL